MLLSQAPGSDQSESRSPGEAWVSKIAIPGGFLLSLCLLKTPEATSPTGAPLQECSLPQASASCWEYATGSINEKCTLVVSAPTLDLSLQQTPTSALGSWGAAGQQGLLHPGTPYA